MTKTSNWRLRALPDLSRPLAYISTIDFSNPSLRDAHPPPQISKARVAADRIRHRLVFIKKKPIAPLHSLAQAGSAFDRSRGITPRDCGRRLSSGPFPVNHFFDSTAGLQVEQLLSAIPTYF
jgi:hypothetical protein